jgi:hypothetical protein
MMRHLSSAAMIGALLVSACTRDSGLTGPQVPPPPATTTLVATASAKSAGNDVLVLQAMMMQLGSMAGAHNALRTVRYATPGYATPGRTQGGASLDLTYGGLNCTFDATQQLFICPPVALDSMTLSARYVLWHANTVQTAYNDTTTDSAQVWYDAKGKLVNPLGAANISRTRTFKVYGLNRTATQRTFGGSGADVATGALGGDSTYVLNDTTIATTVVYGVPFLSNVWPKSGTLETRSQLDLTTGGIKTTTNRRVVITFNGMQVAPMSVDGVGYTVDLGTGAIVKQ